MDPGARPGSVAARLAATIRVLSVEDDPDIAEFLRAYFRASGYDLVHVDPTSAEEVLAAVGSSRADCVLLDIGLRGFSGFDAYDLVRADPRFDHVPIIVVSADETVKQHAEHLSLGSDGVVTKPFNARTLAGVVATHIAAARAAAAPMDAGALTTALDDELATAKGTGAPVTFVLVALRGRPAIATAVGVDGLAYVAREVIRRTWELVPERSVVGFGEGEELAVVLPGMGPGAAVPAVEAAVAAATAAPVILPGGAEVTVEVAAGVASFPDHAGTADELYMAADAALADAMDANAAVSLAI